MLKTKVARHHEVTTSKAVNRWPKQVELMMGTCQKAPATDGSRLVVWLCNNNSKTGQEGRGEYPALQPALPVFDSANVMPPKRVYSPSRDQAEENATSRDDAPHARPAKAGAIQAPVPEPLLAGGRACSCWGGRG